MIRRTVQIAALALVLTMGATACAKKAPAPAPPPPAPAPAAPTEEDIFARTTLEQLNAQRPLADVFFDLDASTIRDDARAALSRNADYLKRWTSTRINVEGHCDERGTAEYNLGLGERRANAVKDYLVSLGIAADRVTIISKGKEAPVCTEQAESCWQQNRRGHFIFTAK